MKSFGIDDLRFLHFVPEVVAFTGPLTDAGEHRESSVVQGNVVDELHDDDGLADTGAAEEADLAALAVGLEKIDDFDAGFEDFGFGVLIFESWRRPVNGIGLRRLDRAHLVDRFSQHVDQPAQCLAADRHRDRRPRVLHLHPTRKTVGGGHGDAADSVFTEVRCDFKGYANGWCTGSLILFLSHFESIVNIGQLSGRKLHVHHRSDDLNDFSCCTHGMLLF